MSNRAELWLPYAGLALMAIGCGRDPTGELRRQLTSPDAATRRVAARDLGRQPVLDYSSITALTAAAADSDADVRRLSAAALGHAGPAAKAAIPALEGALQDPAAPVRWHAALALQSIDSQNRSYAPVLIEALRSADGKMMLAVGRMGPDAAWAVPTLTALLSHDSAKVRALAARTLGQIGPAAGRAQAALERTRRDPNLAVQGAANTALEQVQAAPGDGAR